MFHSGYLLQDQILQKRTHTRLYWVWCFVYSAHQPTDEDLPLPNCAHD